MNILGIRSGAGASVCLFSEGRIKFAVQEERLSRIKNHGGFPERCLRYVADHFSEELESLDHVAICDLRDQTTTHEELHARYHMRFNQVHRTGWEAATFKSKVFLSSLLPKSFLEYMKKPPDLVSEVQKCFPELLLPREAFKRLRHHDCHASAAYYGLAQDFDQPYLVMTIDGGGDRECATISIGHRGRLKRVATTPSGNSIGNIYSNITYMLGFKPHEHEYKVMGLAPYVPDKYGRPVYDKFSKYLGLSNNDGLSFNRMIEEKTTWMGLQLKEDLKYMRFDNIASGLQQFTEHIVMKWVSNAIRKAGVRDLLLSGGVFMNVKMNQNIAEMPEVNSVNVFPSCGDETNPMGLAFHLYSESNGGRLPAFDSFTLGPSPDYDLETVKKAYADRCRFERLKNPNKTIAKFLSDGKIVARCAGPMEFGARALGNRSLLADPINPDVIEKINYMIKQRDFWMPFAPAILLEDTHEYLRVPKTLPLKISPYMMFAFDTTDKRNEMAAALHRADKTARAQVVSKDLYPDFHEIISIFKSLTGRAAVLNTSFNIHGYPIVMGTREAVEILLGTSLEYLVVEDVLIQKRGA